MDVVGAVIIGCLFLPVWLIVPVVIWLDSGWPVIYSHDRVGLGGRRFRLYKFRTMIKDADEVLYKKNRRLLKKFKAGDWKLSGDPRITRLGRFLRNLTIDEFPQLYNVLIGEMSLVGPRAYLGRELTEQTKKYPVTKTWMRQILSVKPGVTGPWQTSGRNIIPFDKRAEMDLNYSQHYNLWWDLLIILKTPTAMLSKW